MATRKVLAAVSTLLGFALARAADAPPLPPVEAPDDPPAVVSRSAQPRTPSAVVVRGNHRSIQVNVDAQGNNIVGDAANEPSMAIDPTNPQRIAIGWRQFDTVISNFRQAGYGYSTDGGQTWTFPGVLQPCQFRSDPVLGSNANGTFYYYSLSSTTSAEMFISANGGATWSGPISAFGGDKTWMTINTAGGSGQGNIYTLWNSSFTCCAPGTDFTRSIDGGTTYDGPFGMSSKIYWGTLDVGNSGEVYAVGVLGSGHAVVKSSDAFDPFLPPTFQTRSMSLGGSTTYGAAFNPGGLAGQVWLAVDHSSGATRGNVYVLASVQRAGDPMDVMFTRSVDGGGLWSAPVRVNTEPSNGQAAQWFGAMSVAPNGRIDVTWNDTRSDPGGIVSEVYYAYSTDAGATWSGGLPVTPAFNPTIGWPDQNKIGDYTHMISDNDGAALAFSATFTGGQDVYFLRLGDCNANARHDSLDVSLGSSEDCDHNLVPDECQENFLCYGPDTDGDGTPDIFDCAVDDPSAWAIPAEVAGDRFLDDKQTLIWTSQATSAGTGTTYDVVRGGIGLFPVVSDPTVVCSASGLHDATLSDATEPAPEEGFYYLVRAGNSCVTAGWGLDSFYRARLAFACDP